MVIALFRTWSLINQKTFLFSHKRLQSKLIHGWKETLSHYHRSADTEELYNLKTDPGERPI